MAGAEVSRPQDCVEREIKYIFQQHARPSLGGRLITRCSKQRVWNDILAAMTDSFMRER